MQQEVEFVSYTRQSIGKLVSSSKHKYTWKIKIEDKEHTVDFYKSKRGRRRVFFNGDKVLQVNVLAADGVSYPFTIKAGARKVDISIVKVFAGEYDLQIGQLSYLKSLKEKPKQQEELADSYTAKMLPAGSTVSYNHFRSELDSDEESDSRRKPTVQNQKKHRPRNSVGWTSMENSSQQQSVMNHAAPWNFSKNPFDDDMKESFNPYVHSSGFSTTKNSDKHHGFDFNFSSPKTEFSTTMPREHISMSSYHTRDSALPDSKNTHSQSRHFSLETSNTQFPFANKASSPSKRPVSNVKIEAPIEKGYSRPANNIHSSQAARSSIMIDLVDLDIPPANSYRPVPQTVTGASQSISFPETNSINASASRLSIGTDLNSSNPMSMASMRSPSHMMTNPTMMQNPMMSSMGNPMMYQYMTSMMMGQMINNPYMPPK